MHAIVIAQLSVCFAMTIAAAETPLPRVLIIGDSIAGGYTASAVSDLEGIATVVKNPGNAAATSTALAKPAAKWDRATDAQGQVPDPTAYASTIDYFLAHGPFAVIHFNWGLHDLKRGGIPIETYLANLDALVTRMRATGATLIFATTTPVPPKNKEQRDPAGVIAFNEAAVALMRAKGVAVDDLYGAILPHIAEMGLTDNVHFGRDGYQFLGRQVAASIRAVLEGKAPPASDAAAPATAAGAPPAAVSEPVPTGGDAVAAKEVAKLVSVTLDPAVPYEWDRMAVGVKQHADRRYTYSSVPDDLVDGYLFRGPHRLPRGTSIGFEFHAPTTVWFCVYHGKPWDGGFNELLQSDGDWRLSEEHVEYENGKRMKMYRQDFHGGSVRILAPESPGREAVVSLVFKPLE